MHAFMQWALLSLQTTASVRVPLIIDTDIGGGGCMCVDDVAAICSAHALADNGEVNLLAVIQNTAPPKLAGVISVLNHYYGRDDVAIGAYKGTDLLTQSTKAFVSDLVENWPSPIKNTSQVPSGVETYRRLLAAQRDHSVVISSIGLLTNIAALLQSESDKHSPFNGQELVARKVKLLAVMGGGYPKSGSRPECNFAGAANGQGPDHIVAVKATAYVVSHWPSTVQLIFSGVELGEKVWAGARLQTCSTTMNPCRQAFIDNWHDRSIAHPFGMNYMSWDPLTTIMAVRGPAAVGCKECINCDGVNTITSALGQNEWTRGIPSNQTYLILQDAEAAGAAIDELLCRAPKNSALGSDFV